MLSPSWGLLHRTVHLCAVLLLLATTCFAQAPREGGEPETPPLPDGFHRKVFRDDAGAHKYVVYVPPDYSPDRKWPVALFLHGAGEKGTDGLKPISLGMAVALEQAAKPQFIAVFPQCEDLEGRYLTGWLQGTPDAERALKILDQVEQEYAIDLERQILCGWSMGGYGTWSLASATPERWSAVLAISGGTTDEGLSLKKLAESGTPVWAVHGRDDALIPDSQSIELIRRLDDAHGRGTLTLLDGIGHDAWRYVFASPSTFEWMINPNSVAPGTIEWGDVKPLPRRSEFAMKYLVRHRRLKNSISLRLGNQALAEMSETIPEALPQQALKGRLPDIVREVQAGDELIKIRLSDVEFKASVKTAHLQAVSGGRFGVEFGLEPLILTIGKGRLVSETREAAFEDMAIIIGRQRPAVLKTEVQPIADCQGLKLTALRQQFQIDEDNWLIRPPRSLQAEGSGLTRRELTIGVVGSLYLRREELEQHILGVVPSLLKIVENELSAVPAPRLARLLWPLPVLVPEISVVPSQVRSDPQGTSLLLDVETLVSHPGPHLTPENELSISSVPHSQDLQLALTLSAVREMSRLAIDDGMAHINVLDIPQPEFAKLADRRIMSDILPAIKELPPEGGKLRSILRLTGPLSIDGSDDEANDDEKQLTLNAPEVALDVSVQTATGQWQGIARFVFSIQQPIEILLDHDHSHRSDAPIESLTVSWNAPPQIDIQRVEPLGEGKAAQSHPDRFQALFAEAWHAWTDRQQPETIVLDTVRVGATGIQLESFVLKQGRVELLLDVVPDARQKAGDSRSQTIQADAKSRVR